jgi:amino acid permease
MQTALIFFTNQVGIGILSLPAMLHTIGLIPGVITSRSGSIYTW